MNRRVEFVPTPRPARLGADGRPWPVCPCGEYQAITPAWQGWWACPCGGAAGEVCSTGTPRWRLFDRTLIDQRRNARQERLEADRADRLRATSITSKRGPSQTER